MNLDLKQFIEKNYKDSKRNLYSAFVERCLELVALGGRIGILTGQTFMFISTFEKFRKTIRQQCKIETLAQFDYGVFDGVRVDTAAFVLQREQDAQARNDSFGTYFRLVKEPNGEAKRRRFEQALANLSTGQPDPIVYRYRQGDFDAIPSGPWVYWITPGLRRVFETFPKLGEIAKPKHGLSTCHNFRYLRQWWEVGESRIMFRCLSGAEAIASGGKWFPYMKGGTFRRWFGNQSFVVNWHSDGRDVKADVVERFPYLKGNWGMVVTNPAYYFRRGVTWTDLTSGRFSARLSPGGFIFDVKGSSAFPDDIPLVLALLNSSFTHYALNLLNPTVSFQVGDIARLPIPSASSPGLSMLVGHAIDLAKADSETDETTYDFIAPPTWETGIEDIATRHRKLAKIEQEIDEEVYRLYGISDEDRRAIEAELAESTTNDAGVDESDDPSTESEDADMAAEAPRTRDELARQWISYAVGIVIGHFQPGIDRALGQGHFSEDIAAKLRALADSDGILVLDQGHPDDLATRVLQALELMLGQDAGAEVIAEATGQAGNPEEKLRGYFEHSFFKEHLGENKYRKRPVYWLLQSPRKMYGIWLFHEKLTRDTLYRVRGKQYVAQKINMLETDIADLRREQNVADGRQRRKLDKQIAELNDMLDDLRAFAERIDAILQRGYTPHIDDGGLINMAPLWELMPSWQAEPKKCWEALARGDYDWSHQAMDHWPERVRKKCQTNKSHAIAHGLA